MDEADKRFLLEHPPLFIAQYFQDQAPKLEPFHVRLIDTALADPRSLTLYPAGHGKSTLVSTLCPILEMCRNPNIRIGLIAKNTDEGEGIMRAIQSQLIENDDLIRDFGPFKPTDDRKSWSLSRIDVAQRTRRGKSSTLAMFGAKSRTVLGYRTDWTICDDVVSEENSATPEARDKLRRWFDLAVITGPEKAESRLTVVGTRFHPNDLYGDLKELEIPDETGEALVPMYSTWREDAIVNDEKHITLWPEQWPWRRLMERKIEAGTLSFNKRYRNIAVDESRMVFREEYVHGGYGGHNGKIHFPGVLDRHYRVGEHGDNWRMVAGFDPAIGTGRHAKFCAHIVVAQGSCRDHERCYWVVDLEREQMTMPQQVDLIMTKHLKYGLNSTQVETNGYQKGLFEAVDQKMKERDLALQINPHHTDSRSKPDPETGVQAIAPWVERGAFHIAWADAHSQRKMQFLVDEMVMYPDSRTTDTVMALWFAWRQLEQVSPRWSAMNRLERDAPMWSSRVGRRIVKNPAFRQRVPLGTEAT